MLFYGNTDADASFRLMILKHLETLVRIISLLASAAAIAEMLSLSELRYDGGMTLNLNPFY